MKTENKLIALVLVVTAFIMAGLVFGDSFNALFYERETVPVRSLVAQTEQFVKDKTGQDYKVISTEWTQPYGLLITGTVGQDVVKFYCSVKEGYMKCNHAQTNGKVFLK